MRRPASWRITAALGVVALAVTSAIPSVHANGVHGRLAGGEEPPTRFERFVVSACSPCLTESHAVGTVSIGALKLPAFPRHAAGPMMRPGELRLDALRAYELGRPSRRSLAIRVTLSVSLGTSGELYRLGVGLLDEDQVPALASAITEISRLAMAGPLVGPLAGGAESADVNFHGGSLRIGLIRFGGETVAYVQAGDVHALALRPVWEVASTIYLPPGQLPAVAAVIDQLAVKVKQLGAL